MDFCLFRNDTHYPCFDMAGYEMEHWNSGALHGDFGAFREVAVTTIVLMEQQATDIQTAKLIKVIPIANSGSAEICPLVHDKASDHVLKDGYRV